LILAAVILQSFQINSLKSSKTVSNSGQIDMSGWSADEKMMYEHHGTLPTRLQGSNSVSQSTGMVGGC